MAFAALGPVCGSIGCGPGLEEIVSAADAPPAPPIRLQAIEYQGYRDGSEEYALRSSQATVRSVGDRAVLLSEVEISFKDPARGDIRVRADRGELDLVTEDFELAGRVNGVLDGQRFQTTELRFDRSQRKLLTDRPVVVERGSLVLRGKGMEYDVDTRKLSFVDVETTAGR